MTQGGPSRHASTREQRSHSQSADTSEYIAAQSGRYPEYSQPSPAHAGSSGAGAGSSGHYYQQQSEGAGHETASYGANSEAGYSESEYVIDEHGRFVRDAQGNKIPYRSPNSPQGGGHAADSRAEDYVTPVPTTSYPPSSSQFAGNHPPGPDYSGQDYAAPGWETMPRHHHPTRLSDVIEEDDERSRTSASQVSRAER